MAWALILVAVTVWGVITFKWYSSGLLSCGFALDFVDQTGLISQLYTTTDAIGHPLERGTII